LSARNANGGSSAQACLPLGCTEVKMSRIANFFLSALVGLIAGCASMSPPLNPAAPADKGKGVLLAALTSDGNPQVMNVWFYYRPRGTTEQRSLARIFHRTP
jgi:hypothetical protein